MLTRIWFGVGNHVRSPEALQSAGNPNRGAVTRHRPCSRLCHLRCTELFLVSHELGDAGAAALASALPTAPQLGTLSLFDNGIGAIGGRVLAAALPRSRLTTLTVWRNDVGDAGAAAFAEALRSVYLAVCTWSAAASRARLRHLHLRI